MILSRETEMPVVDATTKNSTCPQRMDLLQAGEKDANDTINKSQLLR